MDDLFQLECLSCAKTTAAHTGKMRCDSCAGILDIVYPKRSREQLLTPFDELVEPIFLGQGNTPLVKLDRLAEELGVKRLTVKLEYLAPTGSFKDRGAGVLLGAARRDGITGFVEDSSGNAGAAIAACAARAGITANIFLPASAPVGKQNQIKAFGANIFLIEGERSQATHAAVDYVTKNRITYLSHNYSPYFVEGMKSFIQEIPHRTLQEVDYIVLPVGNGSLLIGIWKALKELLAAGVIKRYPRLCVIQAEAVCPIVHAWKGEHGQPPEPRPTVAGGIAVDEPIRIGQVIQALRETDGIAIAVGEREIIDWQVRLSSTEGLFAEPTSAVALAGMQTLITECQIERDSRVLVPLTGNGLKSPIPYFDV